MVLKAAVPGIFWLWVLVACWRVLLAVYVRTSFDPDEYWQGPEVAHRLVFGCESSSFVCWSHLYTMVRMHGGMHLLALVRHLDLRKVVGTGTSHGNGHLGCAVTHIPCCLLQGTHC